MKKEIANTSLVSYTNNQQLIIELNAIGIEAPSERRNRKKNVFTASFVHLGGAIPSLYFPNCYFLYTSFSRSYLYEQLSIVVTVGWYLQYFTGLIYILRLSEFIHA